MVFAGLRAERIRLHVESDGDGCGRDHHQDHGEDEEHYMVSCSGEGHSSCPGGAVGDGQSFGDEQRPDRRSGEENGSIDAPWPQSERKQKQVPAENQSLLTFLLSCIAYSL